jgi:hypothetical protein
LGFVGSHAGGFPAGENERFHDWSLGVSSILGGSLGFSWDKVERMLIFWSKKILSAKEAKVLMKLAGKILVVGGMTYIWEVVHHCRDERRLAPDGVKVV